MQQNLDLAVICCAKAINAMADYWVQAGKECEKCTDESHPDPDQTNITRYLNMIAIAISIILFIGIANVIGIPIMNQIMVYLSAKSKIV